MKDHCGPQGNNALSRIISVLVPDRIWVPFFGWVDFSGCCAQHDADYANSDRRKEADKSFRKCIRCRFNDAAISAGIGAGLFFLIIPLYPPLYVGLLVYGAMNLLGWLTSGWYYLGVRAFGWAFDDD